MKFQNRLQRYYFLRTQPNKMHKNRPYVHKPFDLCNKNSELSVLNSKLFCIFASDYD